MKRYWRNQMTRQEANNKIAETLKNSKISFTLRRGDIGYKAYKCTISSKSTIIAEGIAIYAPTDIFSQRKGKSRAKGRAMQALFYKITGKGNYVAPVRPWLQAMFGKFLCGQDHKTQDAYKGMAYEI